MKRVKSRLFFSVILCGAFVSCSILPKENASTKSLFVIPGIESSNSYTSNEITNDSSQVVKPILYVRSITGSPLFTSRKIVYSTDPYRRSYYRYSFWAEPPTDQIYSLLINEIKKSGVFEFVTGSGSGVRADYQLACNLEEYTHKVISRPGVVELKMTCKLIDVVSRNVIADRSFSHMSEVEKYSAKGAIKGLVDATHQGVGEVVHWVGGFM